ncbi:endolytic transglycosylase MltG [Flavobacterium sp. GT3R68]|uniref:endolytic transglycosylase MltG n=1 Tax=Flavobacterium sp. GT3R68 TaxID=2594437 RepID=UPI000F884B9F|nr:endolytic transglycosylase MltG [Flavobacterium sp. GT3R68]RTY88561.1 endolytic transglycosylase MltG [Flavobacterium sp. GSN2]TRW90594.1 endolytic transglycosylase MltG [Flavobacterium sp. GT3R68]
MKNKKILSIVSILVILALMVYGYKLYRDIFSDNTKFAEDEFFVHVPTDATYADVKKIINPFIKDMDRFEMVANKRSYPENVKSGRFLFKKGMNSFELVNAMRQNVPVKLAFNNQERLENVAGRVGSQIEADSTSLMKTFTDSTFLKENGLTKDNVLSICIPNTYEFYWNTSAIKFRDKMIKEYRKFWNEERTAKAAKLGFTPIQATTLASIVHKETVKKDERPRVARVYINRLKLEMPLQADPTVIFAKKKQLGDFDTIIKRVYFNDLKISSPFNTYMNIGLPPGPIAMPDITAIDAVLDPENNDYLYFCASVTKFGYHEFASTLSQHAVNRKKYVEWLNKQALEREVLRK